MKTTIKNLDNMMSASRVINRVIELIDQRQINNINLDKYLANEKPEVLETLESNLIDTRRTAKRVRLSVNAWFRNATLACAIALMAALAPIGAHAQDNNSKPATEQVATQGKQVKKGEPTNLVYTTKDGQRIPVYRGAKGGLFVIRTSAKTGSQYKQYVKEEQCQKA